MLAVFYGNDTVKVRLKARDFAESKKQEMTEAVDLELTELGPGQLAGLAGSVSLFGGAQVYVIDASTALVEAKSELLEALPELAHSTDTFIVIDGPLLVGTSKIYKAAADHIEEHKRRDDAGFNNFALADALLKRDKKSLWLLLAEARLAGSSDEEIIGILWWQLKTMRLAAASSSAAAVGLKDFSYNKAKRALSKFKPGEIEDLSHELLSVLHESRAGRGDLDVALERYVLSI